MIKHYQVTHVLKFHQTEKFSYVLFLLIPCCTGVRVRLSIVEPLFLFFLSIVFYQSPALSIFHPSPIFSYPSSCSPPISAEAFPFSCVLDVFPPQLSLLVCLHPPLPSGLPISSCFSPVFLLGCIASQPLSSGCSSFFCPPSLFLLFNKPSCSHKLAVSVVIYELKIHQMAAGCHIYDKKRTRTRSSILTHK